MVILFLVTIGVAGVYYSYVMEETQPAVQEERIEEEKLPDPEVI